MFHGVIQKIILAQFFFETRCISNFLLIARDKEFRISVNIWRNYGQECGVLFLDSCTVCISAATRFPIRQGASSHVSKHDSDFTSLSPVGSQDNALTQIYDMASLPPRDFAINVQHASRISARVFAIHVVTDTRSWIPLLSENNCFMSSFGACWTVLLDRRDRRCLVTCGRHPLLFCRQQKIC